jgi:single-strand DNA-binding protein
MNLNEVTIIGRVTQAPEAKSLPSGTTVTSFSIATNRTYKDKDGNKQEETDFHNIVAFAGLADTIVRYVVKGQEILIKGRLKTRSWDKDGTKMYRTEIIAEKMEFGQKPQGTQESTPASTAPDYPEEEINPEDIPF